MICKSAMLFWFMCLCCNMECSRGTLAINKRLSNNELTNITNHYKNHCNENQLLIQLAQLYAISPERIVLLFTTDSIEKTCRDISGVLKHVNTSLAGCSTLQDSNLYAKLLKGLQYFYTSICTQQNNKTAPNPIKQYHDCLKELRADLTECEGPADWFEKTNETFVCPLFNDIINCNYVKAAMLCGLKPAALLRAFSTEVIKKVMLGKCKVSPLLPHVDDPMPSRNFSSQLMVTFRSSCICIFILIACNI